MTLHERCSLLFDRYPLAVSDGRLMVLATPEGGFHILARIRRGWQMWPWSGGRDAFITPDADTAGAEYADAVMRGIPLPRHESVFGWVDAWQVTALILPYTEMVWSPEAARPYFSVMAAEGGTRRQRAPFAESTAVAAAAMEFWDGYEAGRIADLTTVIGGSRDTVLWAPADIAGAGAAVLAVRRQLASGPGGWTLPAGVYVFSRVLHAGQPVPSLAEALAARDATDLGPRFRPHRGASLTVGRTKHRPPPMWLASATSAVARGFAIAIVPGPARPLCARLLERGRPPRFCADREEGAGHE
jgi:hypothetical protein